MSDGLQYWVNAHNEGGQPTSLVSRGVSLRARSYITRGRLRVIAREGVNLRFGDSSAHPTSENGDGGYGFERPHIHEHCYRNDVTTESIDLRK